jgi:hypothetical protein
MADRQRPPPPRVPDAWRSVWNGDETSHSSFLISSLLTHAIEQYQRYFFVDRFARRPTWTNPILLNERWSSEHRNVPSRHRTSSGGASTPDSIEQAPEPIVDEHQSWHHSVNENDPPSPGPILGEQPILQELMNGNDDPDPGPVLEEQPTSFESVNESQAPGLEPEFAMSGAISASTPEPGAQSPVPAPEETAQSPDPSPDQTDQALVPDSEPQATADTPAEAQSHPDNAPGRSRKRDHWFGKWYSRPKGKSPKQNPQPLQEESLESPPCQRPEAQTRPSNQRAARSHSPPTLRAQRQRQSRSEEQPAWMPDMTGFQGSDGARFYWLDPAFIAQRDAEERYRMAEIEAAQRLWETKYRGNGYQPVTTPTVGVSGASYGMGTAGGYVGLSFS